MTKLLVHQQQASSQRVTRSPVRSRLSHPLLLISLGGLLCASACEDASSRRVESSEPDVALLVTSDTRELTDFGDQPRPDLNVETRTDQDVMSAGNEDIGSIDLGRGAERDAERSSPDDMEPMTPECEQSAPLEIVLTEASEQTQRLDPCVSPRWSVGLARGSRWRFEARIDLSGSTPPRLSDSPVTLTLRGVAPDGRAPQTLSVDLNIQRGLARAELEWEVEVTGEHQLSLRDALGGAWATSQDQVEVSARLTCLSGCGLSATRYPVVLIHGYAGVDEYFGVLDYFYRVPETLRDEGFEVWVPSLSPIEWSEERADQLSASLDEASARTGARRFNLIGHSQGGLDARVLISGLGEHERVATLTTIATPHRGIPIRVTDFLSVQDFSPEHLERFNQSYPDHPSVRYFSWSARTCTLVEWRCMRDHNNEVVTPFLLPTYTLLSRFGASDGLVPTANMVYGEHLGVLSADHFDQIGQIADQVDGPFAHRTFYLNEARRLKRLGF